MIGRPHQVTVALRTTRNYWKCRFSLLRDLGEATLDYDEVRERALDLTAALRRHQAREADLILLAYEQDIGAGD